MISYGPLWETMRRKGVTTYKLINNHGFSKGTLDSLKQTRNISTATLNDICKILNCRVEDVLVYIPDTTEDSQK
ncbi:MAG: helix-turn-helix transcriptional regulator [Lawsonibacter sp.]|nr:helix-turn-helix transcriptional regulator [Lawsonibacter sp.]